MYKCQPPRKSKPIFFITLVSTVLACAFLYVGNELQIAKGLMQLAALFLIVFGLYGVIRFALSDMIYSVSDTQFSVTKVTGNKTKELCCLNLETAIDLCDADEYKQKYAKTVSRRYDYHQNLFTKTYFYIFEFNGKNFAMRFEPNEQFLSIMREKISSAVSRQKMSSEPDLHTSD